MPLRVSGVPPLLVQMTVSVSASLSPIVANTREMPSGSVLSMKCTCILSVVGDPSASATNCGPRALPPMPIDRRCVNLGLVGGLILAVWMSPVNVWICVMPSKISLPIFGSGARPGARSQ